MTSSSRQDFKNPLREKPTVSVHILIHENGLNNVIVEGLVNKLMQHMWRAFFTLWDGASISSLVIQKAVFKNHIHSI